MGGNPHQKDSKEKSCPWPSRAINHATSSSIHRTALLPFKSQQSRDLQICLSIHLSRAHAFQKVTGMDTFSQEPSCICSPLVHVCICNKWFAWFTNLHIVPVISSSHPLRQLQATTGWCRRPARHPCARQTGRGGRCARPKPRRRLSGKRWGPRHMW